ncbi:protein usf isoform X2 [Octopus bimaculoides]|uniref:Dienelactone hydrolase domain-containing protein n=1 Tax=Octopus bimaculoides TaxID=37653 RepID=A0A0L8GNN7_OCTBM|nr:protein usf isoform X2 [Octopus bimaculoides]|eukprot:XP_014779635.1 PREDICTED: putative uncharacterized protein YghX isoform X2 [Octopus bimaculoides]
MSTNILSCVVSSIRHTTKRTMSKNVTIPSDNKQGDCPGVLAGDLAKTKRGLIVLQEWWGMNQQIQDEAADLATRGPFVTLVPDLYRGKLATDNEEAGHLMSNLDWNGAVEDIQGSAKYLLKLGCKKVGVTGFCMGGALAFASAVRVPEISASAPFYGIPGEAVADVTKISIPLQCHFGKTDNVAGFSSPVEQEALRKKLDNAKVKHEFHAYDAGHAFTNTTSPGFHKESCDLALGRLIKFMNENL